MSESREWKQYVEMWMEHAKDKDDFLKMFCYFATFNMLYDGEYVKSEREPSQREKIAIFLYNNLQSGTKVEENFTVPQDIKELKRGVNQLHCNKDERTFSSTDKKFRTYILKTINDDTAKWDNEIWKTIDLFIAAYIVRCNLFHGGKCPNDPNDKKFVHEAVVLIEAFLKWFLKYNRDFEWHFHYGVSNEE